MGNLIDQIRQFAVPAPILKKAVLGNLAIPPAEQIEILVFLSSQQAFAADAKRTLDNWDDNIIRDVCSDDETPAEVLRYFLLNDLHRRSEYLTLMIDHPAADEQVLAKVAATATQHEIEVLLTSRAHTLPAVLEAVAANPAASELQVSDSKHLLQNHAPAPPPAAENDDDVAAMEILNQFVKEHAEEIAAEADSKFQLTKGTADEKDDIAELLETIDVPAAAKQAAPEVAKKSEEHERVSVLQKISRMSVGERVQLAMKGTKDERFILIRDGSRVVSLAVLESPKVTDTEVEGFATMKNVQEIVLRGIASKRKFMKKYGVIRALINNPRTPLDLGLNLLPHLLAVDLKNLSANKNVGDTLRKVALKFWKDRQQKK